MASLLDSVGPRSPTRPLHGAAGLARSAAMERPTAKFAGRFWAESQGDENGVDSGGASNAYAATDWPPTARLCSRKSRDGWGNVPSGKGGGL